nr:chromo domain-containing protein 2 [Quercus suber]
MGETKVSLNTSVLSGIHLRSTSEHASYANGPCATPPQVRCANTDEFTANFGAVDSDDDLDIPDVIPAKAPVIESKNEEDDTVEAIDGDDEDDDDEDVDEDEYRVEKILKHGFSGDDNHVVYLIKWLGFEKKADQTWEPLENLTGAPELLDEYHEKIGGVPVYEPKGSVAARNGKGRKRGAVDAFETLTAPDGDKKQKKVGRKSNGVAAEDEGEAKKVLPSGQWETDITRISSVLEEEKQAQGGKGKIEKQLTVFVQWNTGQKTQHPMAMIRRKCPQRLLDYYEQHLNFNYA